MINRQCWKLGGLWGLKTEDYQTFIGSKRSAKVERILELGSGNSTCQFASDFPKAQVTSLDSSRHFVAESRRLLARADLQNAEVLYAPIRPFSLKGALFLTYSRCQLNNRSGFDLMLVDGPPEGRFCGGREASLYAFFDSLSPGCLIGVDDYHRETARKSVRNWCAVFGTALEIVVETATFAVLRKKKEVSTIRLTPTMCAESYVLTARTLLKLLNRHLVSAKEYLAK